MLTSLSIQQVLELANFARGLNSQDVTQMALGLPDYGYGETLDTYEGVIWVEEPLWGVINKTINQVFPESTTSKPVSLQSLSPMDYQMVQKEKAHVLIENGSQDEAAGKKLKTVLVKDGFLVSTVRQADRPYLATQIEYFKPQVANTSRILGQLFGVLASTSAFAPPKGVDIILIIGQDSAASVACNWLRWSQMLCTKICILLYPYEVQTHMKSPPAFRGQMFTNYPILSPMGNALLMYFQL